jgi:hypothetical protein
MCWISAGSEKQCVWPRWAQGPCTLPKNPPDALSVDLEVNSWPSELVESLRPLSIKHHIVCTRGYACQTFPFNKAIHSSKRHRNRGLPQGGADSGKDSWILSNDETEVFINIKNKLWDLEGQIEEAIWDKNDAPRKFYLDIRSSAVFWAMTTVPEIAWPYIQMMITCVFLPIPWGILGSIITGLLVYNRLNERISIQYSIVKFVHPHSQANR